ncbi:MAG: patatin-like phospholipase family protein [Dehalococcoidia bacterium]|nr:patatin-like phospholipase family protein [Dehalococcoidia bacterium]
MAIQFRNLVFEGGGMRGIAYVGAMRVMEQRGALKHISRVGGTSAGAINALVYALGYDIAEQGQIMAATDFRKFRDHSWVGGDIRRLVKNFGWYKGDSFADWIGGLIEKKLGKQEATFQDLKNAGRPDLYIVGTNLTTGFAEVFSNERHKDMPLAVAVRISMSIPIFFASMRQGLRKDVYVDGGVVMNYPVKLFDREKYIDVKNEAYAGLPTEYYNQQNVSFAREKPGRSPYIYNRQTLGLRLDTREEIGLYRYDEPPKDKPIQGFRDYAAALIGTLMRVQENQHLHSDDWQRTLYIDTLDVGTTDFGLTEERKAALIQSGSDCAEKYFTWLEDPAQSPKNRVG